MIPLFAMVVLLNLLHFTILTTPVWANIQCNQCHGSSTPPDFRPIDAAHRNISTGAFRGSHRKHMGSGVQPVACAVCHPGSADYATDHRDGLITVSLAAPAVYRNGSSVFPQTTEPRLSSCTNVSCHSDGTGVATGSIISSETPPWGQAGALTCSGCHAYPPAYLTGVPKINSHARHDFSCGRCHYPTTVTGTAISNPAVHGNAAYDVSAPPGETFFYTGASQCADAYCHGNGTRLVTGATTGGLSPAWGTSAAFTCNSCHESPPAYPNSEPKANAHQKHRALGYGCSQCHYATTQTGTSIVAGSKTHANRVYDVAGPPTQPISYAFSAAGGSCATYCHANGTTLVTGSTGGSVSPSWGSNAALGCTSCHGTPPAYASAAPKANAHLLHASYNYTCNQCHYATTQDGISLAPGSGSHVNRVYDVSGPPGRPVSYAFSPTGGSCSATYCHSSGQGLTNPGDSPVYTEPRWNERRTVRCKYCHKAGYHTADSFQMDSGSHFKHLKFTNTLSVCSRCHYSPRYGSNPSCNECHNPGTTQIGSNLYLDETPRGPEHANGVIDVAFDPMFPAAGATGSYSGDSVPGTSFGSCKNFYCHSQGTTVTPPYPLGNISTVTWGGGPLPIDCTGCHGGDANSSRPLATRSHGAHNVYDCARCHSQTVYTSRSAIPNRPYSSEFPMYATGSYHANGNVEVSFLNSSAAVNGSYAGMTVTYNRPAGSPPARCSNTYCHSNGTAVAVGGGFGNVSTPIWGSGVRLRCNSCHGSPPAYTDGTPKGNAHLTHTANCAVCHNGTTSDNTSIADRNKHAQHRYELQAEAGTTFNYQFSTTGSYCSNVSCHSNVAEIRDWGNNCLRCHGNPPAYPNHNPKANSHLGSHAPLGCQNCHFTVTANGKVISSSTLHNNGSYDLAPGPGVGFSTSVGSTTVCSSVTCHSDGTSIATGIPHSTTTGPMWGGWNDQPLSCYECHRDVYYSAAADYPNGSPKANSHAAHIRNLPSSCRHCHSGVTSNGMTITTPAKHKNGQYDVTPAQNSLGFTYAFGTNADHSRGGTCTNLYCHTDGTVTVSGANFNASAVWGGPSYSCAGCHGNPPSYPNGSPKVNSHQGGHSGYSCNHCHGSAAAIAGGQHADGAYSVSSAFSAMPVSYFKGYMLYKGYVSQCDNTYCHSDGTAAVTNTVANGQAVYWGDAALLCTSCHGMPPSYGDSTPKANLHPEHAAYGCQTCHVGVTTDGTTIANRAIHANGAYDVAASGTASFVYTFSKGGSSCANVSCHVTAPATANWSRYASAPVSYTPNYWPVPLPTTISVTFAEDMDAASLTPATFTLLNGSTPIAGSVAYDAPTRTATFIPTAPLDYGNPYRAEVSPGVRNKLGNPLLRSYSWSFTTQTTANLTTVYQTDFPTGLILPFSGNNWIGVWPGLNGGTALYNMRDGYVKTNEAGTIDNRIVSPVFDLSGYQSAFLSFATALEMRSPTTVADVDVSINGTDGPWINIAKGTTSQALISSICFSSIAKGQSRVAIRFRFTSQNTGATGFWAVDDVRVTGDPR